MRFCALIVVLLLLAPTLLFAQLLDNDPVDRLGARSAAVNAPPVDLWSNTTLIVTDEFDNAGRDRLIAAIAAAGGYVSVVFPPNVMVGRAHPSIHAKLRGTPGIRFVTHQPIAPVDLPAVTNHNAASGLHFFNSVASGRLPREMGRASQAPLKPVNEVVLNPWESGSRSLTTGTDAAGSGVRRDLEMETDHHSGFPNERMEGLILVDVFFVESNGAIDANEYTWTVADHNATADRTVAGLWWWVELSRTYNIQPALTYVMTFQPGSYWQQQQPYEPIRRPGLDEHLWILPIMANWGYTTGDKFQRVRAWNAARRVQVGATHAFSTFVVYNPPALGAPVRHTDGYEAFAWFGDYVKMLFKVGDYPVEQYQRVFTHEMGHIYWACDEYAGACNQPHLQNCANCYTVGPRPAARNWNCETYCSFAPVDCVMRWLTDSVMANQVTCQHTRAMIGW